MREIEKRKEIEREHLKTADALKKVNQELESQRITSCNMAEEADVARKNALENQKFLDTVIDHLPVMVFVKDAINLKYVKFNRAGEQLTGWRSLKTEGKNKNPPRKHIPAITNYCLFNNACPACFRDPSPLTYS